MLVMSVQAVAGVLPFTPGGDRAQQALLVATLEGPGARRRCSPTRSGQQIAIAAWTALLGFLALAFVFRTTNWRGLIRSAEQDAARAARSEAGRGRRRRRRGSASWAPT